MLAFSSHTLSFICLVSVLTVSATVLPAPACAQTSGAAGTQVEIGPRVGFDVGDVEELFIGLDARINDARFPVTAHPALDVYFTEGGSLVQLNLNALYDFDIENTGLFPYAGGGLGFSFVSDSGGSDVGLNLVGGARFASDNIFTPFAQAQFTVGDIDFFALSGGLLFRLGS
jgi:opacity protein-like surface antigen